MELIVISKPSFFKGEAQLINGLFDLGMQRFHLRKERSGKAAYRQLLAGIRPEFRVRIALHQFHELAADFDIQRFHFKEHERLQGLHSVFEDKPSATLSTSTHSIDHIPDLKSFKYTFLGPVFQSISKENYPGVIPGDFQLIRSADTKVIALGGISAANISQVQQMNFDGAAVLGALWNAPEQALQTFKKIKKACQTTG
ncbi:thiamine phosphate synthase [Pedobacter sp. PLR]|uniref:thiamine phosphate synthase n=1 Tax=Pedobacter sp. PLR TaxID=2994465 RepID=UPI002247C6E1|nr:thiamine phosphate synthase [Pedobacter sp. PLR]MCX2453503.1 thiamine phosphate synthase [Pedobacter sp. PLR]